MWAWIGYVTLNLTNQRVQFKPLLVLVVPYIQCSITKLWNICILEIFLLVFYRNKNTCICIKSQLTVHLMLMRSYLCGLKFIHWGSKIKLRCTRRLRRSSNSENTKLLKTSQLWDIVFFYRCELREAVSI